jgi:hypothetical protein
MEIRGQQALPAQIFEFKAEVEAKESGRRQFSQGSYRTPVPIANKVKGQLVTCTPRKKDDDVRPLIGNHIKGKDGNLIVIPQLHDLQGGLHVTNKAESVQR